MHDLNFLMNECMDDWPTNWLTNWLLKWLIDWLIIDWVTRIYFYNYSRPIFLNFVLVLESVCLQRDLVIFKRKAWYMNACFKFFDEWIYEWLTNQLTDQLIA